MSHTTFSADGAHGKYDDRKPETIRMQAEYVEAFLNNFSLEDLDKKLPTLQRAVKKAKTRIRQGTELSREDLTKAADDMAQLRLYQVIKSLAQPTIRLLGPRGKMIRLSDIDLSIQDEVIPLLKRVVQEYKVGDTLGDFIAFTSEVSRTLAQEKFGQLGQETTRAIVDTFIRCMWQLDSVIQSHLSPSPEATQRVKQQVKEEFQLAEEAQSSSPQDVVDRILNELQSGSKQPSEVSSAEMAFLEKHASSTGVGGGRLGYNFQG